MNQTEMNKLRKKCKKELEHRGMTQKDAAKEMGVNVTSLNKWLTSARDTPNTAIQVQKWLEGPGKKRQPHQAPPPPTVTPPPTAAPPPLTSPTVAPLPRTAPTAVDNVHGLSQNNRIQKVTATPKVIPLEQLRYYNNATELGGEKGGQAKVFKVYYDIDNITLDLALKMAKSLQNQKAIDKEIENYRKLGPRANLAKFYGEVSVENRGNAFLLEWIPMQFDEFLVKNINKPITIVEAFFQIANVIDYIHQQGFIHRDIKPGNIMFRENGEPVLLDLGFSREEETAEEREQRDMTVCGTQTYTDYVRMLEHHYGNEVDIYSFGHVIKYTIMRLRKMNAAPNTIFENLDELYHECTNTKWKNRPSAALLAKKLKNLLA